MNKSVNVSRIVSLVALLMAAMVMLSGPVAEVLDLPSSVAEAKKKKINVVQCPGGGFGCFGTDGRDRLVGSDSADRMFGEGGNDVYQANGGNDILTDESPTSSDTYTGYTASFSGFGSDSIADHGGSSDFLDLGSLRLFDEVTVVRFDDSPGPDDLLLDGPAGNDVFINDQFGQGRIEKIKFANATVTGTQAQSLAREASPEEQAALEVKRPDDERPSEDESFPQEEKE